MRATAVVAVIGYHINPNMVPQGFLGVDMFFVISGFVISNLIYSEINNNSFKLSNFFLRRTKRLLPSLLSYSLFVSVVSYLTLDFKNVIETLKTSLYSLIFLANIHIARYLEYFEPDSKSSLVINLWSLSVEEQFYIVLPVLILLFSKVTLKLSTHIYFFILILIISIIFSYQFTFQSIPILGNIFLSYENYLFYSPITRAYQFVVGILAMFIGQIINQKKPRIDIEYIRYIYFLYLPIFLSLITQDSKNNTTLVLLLTFIILSLNISFPHELDLLARPLIFIGNISYSLYLFHQAIISGARNLITYIDTSYKELFNFNNPIFIFILLVVVFSISYLNFVFIENKLRYFRSNNLLKSGLFLLILILGLVTSFLGIFTNGFEFRSNELASFNQNSDLTFLSGTNYLQVNDENCMNREMLDNLCKFSKNNNKNNVFIFGDSMMSSMISGFASSELTNKFTFYEYTKGGCPFIINECDYLVNNQKIVELMNIKDSSIILGGRYQKYLDSPDFKNNLQKTFEVFGKSNDIYFISPIPEPGVNLRMYYFINNQYPNVIQLEHFKNSKRLNQIIINLEIENLSIIFLDDLFCEDSKCKFNDSNYYYFLDHVHFTYYGAEKAATKIMNSLDK